MITKAIIDAQPDIFDETDVANLIAVIKSGDRYKASPFIFLKIQDALDDIDGSVQAKIVNAVIRALEKLGIGEVEINQGQTVGTDGVIFNKHLEREALINYVLNVLYSESFQTIAINPEVIINRVLRGNYVSGRLPLDYQGYL